MMFVYWAKLIVEHLLKQPSSFPASICSGKGCRNKVSTVWLYCDHLYVTLQYIAYTVIFLYVFSMAATHDYFNNRFIGRLFFG